MNSNTIVLVIPLWICALVCFIIAFILSVVKQRNDTPPNPLRAWNWVALGLAFAAATHIWWKP